VRVAILVVNGDRLLSRLEPTLEPERLVRRIEVITGRVAGAVGRRMRNRGSSRKRHSSCSPGVARLGGEPPLRCFGGWVPGFVLAVIEAGSPMPPADRWIMLRMKAG
jgi:hypothetical protein